MSPAIWGALLLTLGSAGPTCAQEARFVERPIVVGQPPWQLPGTLTLPRAGGTFPIVVLVHGSGPQDRDAHVGALRPFRDLAEALASRGIAVLRFDKRSKVFARALARLPGGATTREETEDDAVAALGVARALPGVDPARVFLAGHSLGATLAPRIAQRAPGLAGIVILAGATRPVADVVVDEMEYLARLDGAVTLGEQRQISETRERAARAVAPDLGPGTPSSHLPLGLPAGWWMGLRGYDPAATAAELHLPMLILRGSRDYQCTSADLEGWRHALGGRADVLIEELPGLDHYFMAGSGPSSPGDVETPAHVDPVVIDRVAAFVLGTSAR